MKESIRKNERDSKLSDVKLSYIKKNIAGTEILDVGAGNCYYSDWIVENFPNTKTVAIDHIKIDPKNLSQKISYTQADLEQTLFMQSEKFNTLLAFDIIEHINHEKQLLSELFRVCKPGGILIGSVPNDDDKFLPSYNLTFNHRSDLTHKRYYTEQTIRSALIDAGFINVIIEKQGGASPQVIAEFFPKKIQFLVKKSVGVLRRIGIINTKILASDLFFVAIKPMQ